MSTPNAPPSTPITPDQSHSDDATHRIFTLPNNLQVFLTSDPTTDKSASAMSVKVGHLSDPSNVQGLAHFLEHMLFLGTEKYPDENSYGVYLSKNGGSSNAYTDTEDTVYYFDVNKDAIIEALDRFAQFFIKPLFTEGATEREINAVDSENSKNLQADFWRAFQLLKSIARPEHPFVKFGTGNKDTLNGNVNGESGEGGRSVRDELIAFHERFYSAGVMRLCVISNLGLDELEKIVTEKFSSIPDKGISAPSFPGTPYLPAQIKGRMLSVVPVKELRSIEMTFPMPSSLTSYNVKPLSYLSHLIGHESSGSIISLLKKKGWANELCAGCSRSSSDWCSFNVSIELTDLGMGNTTEIIHIVFAYINLLKTLGPQKWIFEETSSVASNNFRFLSKGKAFNYVSSIVERMSLYPPKRVLSGPYITFDYEPETITKFIEYLKSDNVITCIFGRKFSGLTSEKEKWYGTEYNDERLNDDVLEAWDKATHDQLALPEVNDLIASDFDIRMRTDAYSDGVPKLIQDSDVSQLWFKPDATFNRPKLNVFINLLTPLVYSSPEDYCLSQLFVACVNENLNEYSYMASMSSLHCQISCSRTGIDISLGGFNEKLHVLLSKIIQTITSFIGSVQADVFERIKDRTMKAFKNFTYSQTYQHTSQKVDLILGPSIYPVENRIEALESLALDDLEGFSKRILKSAFVEMFVHGNASEDESIKLLDVVLSGLKPSKIFPANKPNQRVVKLTNGFDYVHDFVGYNGEEVNSCCQNIYQIATLTPTTSSYTVLLQHMLSEPAFDELRTKECLGYVVFTSRKLTESVINIQILIQGSVNSPKFLDDRIENFLVTFRGIINNMSAEDYEQNVQAVVEKHLEKDKNLGEESSRLWSEIKSGRCMFDRNVTEAAVIAGIKKNALLTFFDQYIAVGGRSRAKLSVRSYGKGFDIEAKSVEKVVDVEDAGEFKRNEVLWPLTVTRDLKEFKLA